MIYIAGLDGVCIEGASLIFPASVCYVSVCYVYTHILACRQAERQTGLYSE